MIRNNPTLTIWTIAIALILLFIAALPYKRDNKTPNYIVVGTDTIYKSVTNR